MIGLTGCFALCAVGLLCCTPSMSNAATKDEAITALAAWRQKFASIELTYTSVCRPALEERFPQLKEVAELHGKWGRRTRWRWADLDGYLDDRMSIEDGRIESRVLQGGTSLQGFTASSKRGVDQSEIWEQIQYRIPVGKPTAWAGVISPLYALWINARGKWLDEIISTSESGSDAIPIEWLSDVESEGQRLCRFVLKWPNQNDGRAPREYWLDPQHGYLPRRVFCPTELPAFDYEVNEFSEIETGWWFPSRGHFGNKTRTDVWDEWRVESVMINRSYTPRDFDPPAPSEGTHLRLANGDIKRHRLRLPSDFTSPPVGTTPKPVVPIKAEVGRSNFSRWSFLVAIVLVSLGLWIRVNSKSER